MPRLEKMLNPFIVATQVVPKVALVPLFVVWFGFGITSKVVIAAVLAFFPILLNTLLGVKSVDRGHREVLASLNASRWQSIIELEFPSALPYILTGMEVGVVLAIIGAVVGEYLGGSQGLGNLAVQGDELLQHDGAVRRHHPPLGDRLPLLRRGRRLPPFPHPVARIGPRAAKLKGSSGRARGYSRLPLKHRAH